MASDLNRHDERRESIDGAQRVRHTRVDPPHQLGDRAKVSAEATTATVTETVDVAAQSTASAVDASPCVDMPVAQIERHAEQLSRRLQKRRLDLERREQQLDRQQEELESAQQRARLWLDASRRELERRGAELSANEARLASREARRRVSALGRTVETPEPRTSGAMMESLAPRADELSTMRVELMEQRRRLTVQVSRLRSWFHHRYEALARREDEVRRMEAAARGEIEP